MNLASSFTLTSGRIQLASHALILSSKWCLVFVKPVPVLSGCQLRFVDVSTFCLIFCIHSNWGLTPAELLTLPPALARSFSRSIKGGFGSDIGGDWGRLLMRGEKNAELYGPLQTLYEEGKAKGTDVWIHKNRCVIPQLRCSGSHIHIR